MKKKKKTHKHPEKKSSRQILISTWPYTSVPLAEHWPSFVLISSANLLRILSQAGFSPSWETSQITWEAEAAGLEADSPPSGFPHAPAWPGEGPGPRFAPVHEFASYHISPLSGQESHGHILIKSRKGHMEVSSSPITLFTGWEADSVRWVPSSRGRRYGRAPGQLLQSTARLDRDVDRCKSRTQPQNINEAERLGQETAKQASQHICQVDKGRVLRKDRCKYWWCYSRRDCKKRLPLWSNSSPLMWLSL